MRSPLLLTILVAATVGACDQSLAPTMTGTGGTGPGPGTGYGGAYPGTGGVGGNDGGGPICNARVVEYQSALAEAQRCQVGASGQCQQIVSAALSGCTCPTYVTDSSALTVIVDDWEEAGCALSTGGCMILCPAALNSTCVATDGGSAGVCSFVPGSGGSSGTGGSGATGGTSGAGGSPLDGGVDVCGRFAAEYAAVLVGAKSCTSGALPQCEEEVPSALSPCAGCPEIVNDATVLSDIQNEWSAAGCGAVTVNCPAIACPTRMTGLCVPSDAGGSVCADEYPSASN